MFGKLKQWWRDRRYWSRWYNTIIFLHHECTEEDKDGILITMTVEELKQAYDTKRFMMWYERNKEDINNDDEDTSVEDTSNAKTTNNI